MKKLIGAILCLALLASLAAQFASYASGEPGFSVTGTTVTAGESFTVPVVIENNPGIWSTKIFVYYDPALTVTAVACGDVFAASEMTAASNFNLPAATNSNARRTFNEWGIAPGNYNSTCVYFMNNEDDDVTGSGVLANVTLTAPETPGEYFIGIIYTQDDTFNNDEEDVVFTFGSDVITVEEAQVTVIPGDVNGDTKINSRDLSLIKKYISGVVNEDEIDFANADINVDGKVNTKDTALLKRLIAQG